jgi:hypothetical protein
MRKYTVALALAALAVAAANPAFACGASGGKAYRAVQTVKKTTVAQRAGPGNASADLATTEGLQRTTAAETVTSATSAEL